MPVVDLITPFTVAIENESNVKLLAIELHVLDKQPCLNEGRARASRD